MAYTVLARKYRPQTFSDLVGQEHVTRTLTNAIRSGRVAHAFLFTGVRGVGKTTTARIVAKALNCEAGPTPEPCGVCDPCREITAGRDTDVIEMDGASNNSVEDVRRLQESIPYRPSRDRFKIVIVDEVHMLSTGAFNAFLKTLEEPPPHVKFIFATTESHKVPVTIRSRCQRYDFRLIPQTVVSRRVREILAAEGIEADDAAVAIVAREAAGSMRDALTLLDQIVAFGGEKLVGEEVARVLGIADRDVLHRVAGAVLDGDGAEALRAVAELADKGLDMLHFARQLLDLVRDMVVLRVCGGATDLVTLVEEERVRAREVAERTEVAELQRAFTALSKVVDDVAMSGTPRTTLEMGLVRLATRPPLRPLAELVARLEELEKRAGGGGPGGSGGRRPAPTGNRSLRGGMSAAEASASFAPATSAPTFEAPPIAAEIGSSRLDRDEPSRTTAMATTGEAKPAPTPPTPQPPPRRLAEEPPARASDGRDNDAAASRTVGPPPRPTAGSSATTNASAAEPTSNGDSSLDPGAAPVIGDAADGSSRAAWQEVVSALLDSKPALGAVLQHGAPLEISAERIVLAFPKGSFFGEQAKTPDARRSTAEAAAKVLGRQPHVEIVYSEDAHTSTKTLAQEQAEQREARISATRARALEHPLVHEVALQFNVPRDRMTVHVEMD